ncbi:DUF2156 domain-containing protein [Helicobacter trogontum]|uniref:DUF2156 domain-containing protein n=1 Tax=Helicobacter trogontum TaxID=50960 RepID=A0A4U8TB77_9HELI|nr:phosphatidylglycerol lysyltransferase domain-containing protein [Helicobacter trogontum]MCI5786621.1 phosphatidylglycerol lysyltransferase domain-containing protein [Helicobacter trogontum]MDY5184634.1 phosphatidylglycerol lysyltransferase domain-containing protein [Helicobacter trogontum]TLD97129.1 DUF2156 domain-containing protein [Helicobacter trogontum]
MEKQAIVFQDITLQDKTIINTYLKQENFMISDISFGNLFIWRLARKIAFCILYDCLVIETTYTNQEPFCFFPIGSGDKKAALFALYSYYKQKGQKLVFHSVEKQNLDVLYEVFGDTIMPILNRDRSDYIYKTQDLIELTGRKYHKKKNHLNRFFDEYRGFTFETIDENNTNELLETWQKWDNSGSDIGLQNESKGIISVFENYSNLGLLGGLLRFNDDIIAFSFGEIMSQNLCIIHIEKADINYRGAYQAINQQLLLHCFSDITYVNREEDLGIEGLRKAKLSYNPEFILEKYELSIV